MVKVNIFPARRLCLRVSLVAVAVPGLMLSARAGGPARPLVLVFAAKVDSSKTDRVPPAAPATENVTDDKGKKNDKDAPAGPVMSGDKTMDWNRAQLAARAVRDVLREGGIVDASLYSPDAPTFVLAVRENKMTLSDGESPSPNERVALGRAVGATYVIGVVALQPGGAGDGSDLEIYTTDVASKKTFAFRAQSRQESRGGSRTRTIGVDGQPGPYPVSLVSAANMLVTRFLAGPLGEYTRATPPPALLPPKPTASDPEPPVVVAAPPPSGTTPSPRAGTGAGAGAGAPPLTPVEPVIAAGPPVSPPKTLPQNDPVPAPPVVLPPRQPATTTPPPDIAPPVRNNPPAVDVEAVRRQADALIASGDVNAAITALRHAINQAPRDTSLRIGLVRAYLSASRENDANAEARRGLAIASPDDRRGRLELTRLLAQALSKNGDTTAARVTYQETIEAEPSAIWPRVALAELLMTEGQKAAAEAQLRAARKIAPDDRDVALTLARLLAQKGDYKGALAEITNGGEGDATGRNLAARAIFDEGAKRVAGLLTQNRAAWEDGSLSREAFYKATAAQSERAAALLNLLKSVPPPATGADANVLTQAHKRRVLAAALLSQSVAAMVTFLETGKASDGAEARFLLGEFQKEMDAGGATPSGGAASGSGVIVVQ